MSDLALLQLFATKINCEIQHNIFKGAHIGGMVTINDGHSGENFCGNAGDTTGHSKYINETDSKSTSKSASSATSKASTGGHAKSHHAKKDQSCGHGWGQSPCKKVMILMI